MPRNRNNDPIIATDTDIATGASTGPQEEATAVQAAEESTVEADTSAENTTGGDQSPDEEEQTFTLPAEDEGASLVRPGIGMEDVPVPELQPDPEDFNEAVFAKKREAWEQANPEAVQQNKDRDKAHEEGKPYQPETDKPVR